MASLKEQESSDSLLPPPSNKRKPQRFTLNTPRCFIAGLIIYFLFLICYYRHAGVGFCGLRGSNIKDNPPSPAPMKVFQVCPPVRVDRKYLPGVPLPQGKKECEVLLLQHEFGFSYGLPAVGQYSPPECEWTHVAFTLTVTSNGRQFDRLAVLFLGDVEVWRTSTAEPTWYGIEFGYTKDMTAFSSLLRRPQKLIFDMGNLVNDIYNGTFDTTLRASFYTPILPVAASPPATDILSISSAQSAKGQPSYFHIPSQSATSQLHLPRNTIRAIISISASGNAEEEFWYTNVLSPFTHTFPSNPPLPGYSPFREIQVLVDGDLIGVAWPYPVIYTGGINPRLWRPIVGIATFDVPTYEIDITPYLPLLLREGAESKVWEIRVVSHDPQSGNAIGSDWIVTGQVFIWTDEDRSWVTTGTINHHVVSEPIFSAQVAISTDSHGRNTSLQTRLQGSRSISISSTINTSSGARKAIFTQGLSYSNVNTVTNNGETQLVTQVSSGSSFSTTAGGKTSTYRYPLTVNSTYRMLPEGGFYISADVQLTVEESNASPGLLLLGRQGHLTSTLNGSAEYYSNGKPGKGNTQQVLGYAGVGVGEVLASYWRRVAAEKAVLSYDEEWVNGRKVDVWWPDNDGGEKGVEVGWRAGRGSVREMLGRGPRAGTVNG